MDLSLFLSVLGVILTIIFFVIGYRQTIGARRERARAANQALVDTLFRRLALEENFALTRSDVAKVISGWAINARVRSSDIHSLQELEDLLCARALESDYIAEGQRETIGARISRMFGEEKNPIFIGKEKPEANKIRPEVPLAIGSGLASIAAAFFATLFLTGGEGILTKTLIESAIVPAIAFIVLTVLALLFYIRVRDISRLDITFPTSSRTNGMDLEREFFRLARRRNKSVRPSSDPAFDFTLEDQDGITGIEIKSDVNRIGRMSLKRIVNQLKSSIENGNVSKIIILSATKPDLNIHKIDDDRIIIKNMWDFLRELPEANQIKRNEDVEKNDSHFQETQRN